MLRDIFTSTTKGYVCTPVFLSLFLSVCLSLCLSLSVSRIYQSLSQIWAKLGGQIECVIRWNWFDFGGDPDSIIFWFSKWFFTNERWWQKWYIARYLKRLWNVDGLWQNLVDEMCVDPHGSRTVNQNSTSSLTLQEVMDWGWLVHGFSAHRLITGLGFPTLVMWQRTLTMCSLMVSGGWSRIQGLPECSVPQYRPQACCSNSEVAA